MINPRIIPILLLRNGGLVKTMNFKNPIYLGDPINAVRIFNEKEVDEIVLLDIEASIKEQEPNYKTIKDIVSEGFMPMGYGGGLNSIERIKKLFDTGIEKVIINSALFDFKLIEKAASIFGCQSIVVSIDTREIKHGNYKVYTMSGNRQHNVTPVDIADKVVNSGAGEIIIQSIDRDGTMIGYDLAIIKSISDGVSVPVVASGGAGTIAHFRDAIFKAHASAVAAGSIFVFKGRERGILINYPSKELIKNTFNNE